MFNYNLFFFFFHSSFFYFFVFTQQIAFFSKYVIDRQTLCNRNSRSLWVCRKKEREREREWERAIARAQNAFKMNEFTAILLSGERIFHWKLYHHQHHHQHANEMMIAVSIVAKNRSTATNYCHCILAVWGIQLQIVSVWVTVVPWKSINKQTNNAKIYRQYPAWRDYGHHLCKILRTINTLENRLIIEFNLRL